MDDLTALAREAKLLVSYALLHGVALADDVIKTLIEADATKLVGDTTARDTFLVAFASANQAIGVGASQIRTQSARTARLRRLVEDSRTLLDFAASNGKTVDDATRNDLVAVANAVDAGTTTVEEEQTFLKAYEDLTKALAPITVETLEASTTKLPTFADLRPGGGITRVPIWTLGRFINVAVFVAVLIGTGITLGYYSVGSTGLAKYRDLLANQVTLKKKEVDAYRDRAIKEAASKGKAGSAQTSEEEATLRGAVAQAHEDFDAILRQQEAVRVELQTVPERLGRWAMQPCLSNNPIFRSALCPGVDEPDREVAAKREASAAVTRAASAPALSFPSYEPAVDPRAQLRGSLVDVEAARTVASRLSEVYLPLLLGFLGAQAFILRRMSKEITERTFAKGSAFNHTVRIGLGALAGLASTWLLTPEGVGGTPLKALPTWALAFIAGYGIELVFAFMDRIILAFTAPTK